MTTLSRLAVSAVVIAGLVPEAAHARPGGGRGGGGHPAGAMARPAGGMSRPAMPAARPSAPAARPSMPAARPQMPTARPSMPNVARPQPTQRPSLGNAQPPAMPTATARPSLPTAGARPALPSTAPRPGIGSLRPGAATRPAPTPGLALPGQVGGGRPGGIAGPTTRPAPQPGLGGGPGGNRPGLGSVQRPTTVPGTLPGGNRPGIGGSRPGIGDGNNLWNSGNINSGNWNNTINNVNVNRPWGGAGWASGHGGYGGWGYPGSGGGWGNAWHGGCVNPHYGWYNGCWGGGWWAPFAIGAATWGLASTVANWGLGYGAWGYSTAYANPYYTSVPAAVVAASPYDYAQPVAVTTYATDAAAPAEAAAPADSVTEAERAFDEALARFKAGDYTAALAGCDKAVKLGPKDPIVHEVRALALFALARYPEAAATLNAVLASAPGMDWTTLSGLYGSVDAYTLQLRKLEEFCQAHPTDAAAWFVLAYHYLVGGHTDMAADALRVVVAKQPGDVVAKQLLAALEPQPATEPAPAAGPAAAGPETDLVGTWQAKAGDDAVTLTIKDDSTFAWKATPRGQPAVEITGTIETSHDAIALVSEKAGTMGGTVASQGPDAFEFTLAGGPPGAKPLAFQRQK
ncbi:MAG: tetratricopeptide repeat protein [Planctomycetaceae bacterium]